MDYMQIQTRGYCCSWVATWASIGRAHMPVVGVGVAVGVGATATARCCP